MKCFCPHSELQYPMSNYQFLPINSSMKAALSPSWSSFLEYSLEAIPYNIHVIVKLYIAIIK